MIKVISDSTCDLSNEMLERFDITIVPLHIVLGTQEYRDRIEISQHEIFEWADANKTTPKTSAISFDDAKEIIEPIIEAGDEVVCFTISESMSTTGNVFRLVGEELEAPDRVHVYNSKSLSNGVGILAIVASKLAKEGKTYSEMLPILDEYRDKLCISFVVDTLVYLARGGRCSAATALMGSVLKLHPKIILTGGAMEADKKYRGAMSSVVLNYAKDMEDKLLNARKEMVFLISTEQNPAIVDSVREYLKSLNYFDEIVESVAGGVISSHCGPGTLGIMFVAK